MLGFATGLEHKRLLRQWVSSKDEPAAEAALERLLHRFALPVVDGVLARRIGRAEDSDAETARTLALSHLIQRLREAREQGQTEPFRDFRAYVAAATHRGFAQMLEEKYPERGRLRRRLRYLLTHQPGLALWQDTSGDWVCGLTAWQGQEARESERLARLRDAPEEVAENALSPRNAPQLPRMATGREASRDPKKTHPAALVWALLRWVGHPVPLDEIGPAFAAIRDIQDVQLQTGDTESETGGVPSVYETVADPTPLAEQVEQQEYLRSLWGLICRLPIRQRFVLLLQLRDSGGGSLIEVFPLHGIATRREIADALEMPWERFAVLWNELPLEDTRIAEILGISKENVRYLRCTARARLTEWAVRL